MSVARSVAFQAIFVALAEGRSAGMNAFQKAISRDSGSIGLPPV